MTEQYEITYWGTLVSNPVAIGVVIGFIILFSAILWLRYRPRNLSAKVETKQIAKVVEDKPESATEKQESILGTGQYKCMAFRQGNILDFTTIPEPIGEVYFFDPTCPTSGAGYIVREAKEGEIINGRKTKKGEIVDYDPREVQVVIEKTPEYAWHAMNWTDDVEGFWIVPISFWKTPSMWFAVGMIIIVFVSTLVVLD